MSSGDAIAGTGDFRDGSFEGRHRIVNGDEHENLRNVAEASGPISIAPTHADIFAEAVSTAARGCASANRCCHMACVPDKWRAISVTPRNIDCCTSHRT